MAALKQYGFAIFNGVVLLATLIVYFLFISGRGEQVASAEKKLDKDLRSFSSLMKGKPTQAWYALVEENKKKLEDAAMDLEAPLLKADSHISRFFDLEQRSELTDEIPQPNYYQEFKELMAEKWNALSSAFSGKGGPFGYASESLKKLEPSWLRNESSPSGEQDVVDSMKKYWIVVELLELLSEQKILVLDELGVGDVVVDPLYQLGAEPFWGYRPILIKGRLQVGKEEGLFRAFHYSKHRFRVLGFTFDNVQTAPQGVTSNAPFVSFQDPEILDFELRLNHYDYRNEGESLVAAKEEEVGRRGRRRGR